MHQPRQISPRLLSIAMAIGALVLAPAALAQGPRPAHLKLLPGSVEIRNVQYAEGTLPDLTKPAAGTGELVVTVKSQPPYTKPGVRFTNLLSDAAGKVTGIAVMLDSPFEAANFLGTGANLTIPSGQISFVAPDKLAVSAAGTLKLPFRTPAGNPIECAVQTLKGQALANGSTSLTLEGITLKGDAAASGLKFPGIQIKAAPLNLAMTWSPTTPLQWNLNAPSIDVACGIPGLPTQPELPLEARVTGLEVNQAGTVKFQDATLTVGKPISLLEAAGFELAVLRGKLAYSNGTPAVSDLAFSVKLPPGFVNQDPTKPIQIEDINVLDGFTGKVKNPFSFKFQNVTLSSLGESLVDFSNGPALPGTPPGAGGPAWMGLFVSNGKLRFDFGADRIELNAQNFLLGPTGLFGKVELTTPLPELKLAGFSLKGVKGRLEFDRSLLRAADLEGALDLGGLGNLDAAVSFSLDGKFGFRIKPGETLPLDSVGMKVQELKCRFDGRFLCLSGKMSIDPSKTIVDLPAALRQFNISITDLKVDNTGKLYLPEEGWITFPNPQPIDLGVISVEIRRFGFTTENNRVDSISFSGGAKLNGAIPDLPIGGELDFEGFTIEKDGSRIEFSLGGIGVAAEVLGIGRVEGSLYRETLPGFGDTLYGDCELKLTCLGNMPIGIGLDFLLAPEKTAFFVGGFVEGFQILVQLPTPSGAPIPLFHIMGFSGGFGLNVAPKRPGEGRISMPKDQLVYDLGNAMLQAGLLLADQVPGAPGHIWWADASLTLTLNPITVDLTARASFLDPQAVEFIDVDEWEERDRIARIFLNVDFSKPSLTIGGDADLTFPTRSASVIDASGEAELKVSPQESYIRIGWKDAGQKPLKVRLAKAIRNVADIEAEAGLEVLFKANPSAKLYVKAKAEIELADFEIEAKIKGRLNVEGIGGSKFRASGSVEISGRADFGLVEAEGEGRLDAEFNTAGHANELYFSGRVRGKAGPFEGSALVRLTIPVRA